jgi:hypothetical protein
VIGHKDDITCCTISNNGRLGAVGSIASADVRPHIQIFDITTISNDMPLGYTRNLNAKCGEIRDWFWTERVPLTIIYSESSANVVDGESPYGLVAKIGYGFFQRAVGSVQFTFDNAYIVGIGCDDYHTMGVWYDVMLLLYD